MPEPKKTKPQTEFDGFRPPHIKEIEDAAEELKEIRDKRMDLGEKEEKAQSELVAVMKKHGLKRYPIDDDFEAIVEAKERGFVRKRKRSEAVVSEKKATKEEKKAAKESGDDPE